MDKMIITINGGAIQTIFSNNKNIQIEIIDYDGYLEGQNKEETKRVNQLEKESLKMKVLY